MLWDQRTEIDAYIFIKENFKLNDWNTSNLASNPKGQVYTQNECVRHLKIHAQLGMDKTENIDKVTESIFWVIEAKRNYNPLEQTLKEAQKYAEKINKSGLISAKFITGAAGNDVDNYLIKTVHCKGNEFTPITINDVFILTKIGRCYV